MNKANPKVTDELKAALTPEERKEVATWIAGHASVERLKQELAVRTLQERMTLAEQWFDTQKGEDARFLAASLVPAWARLRASLKKKRPSRMISDSRGECRRYSAIIMF